MQTHVFINCKPEGYVAGPTRERDRVVSSPAIVELDSSKIAARKVWYPDVREFFTASGSIDRSEVSGVDVENGWIGGKKGGR